MDGLFWWGIGIGAVLSFAASVLANLLMGRISAFVATRSKSFRLRQESKNIERLTLVQEMVDEPPLFMAYIARIQSRISVFSALFIVTAMFILSGQLYEFFATPYGEDFRMLTILIFLTTIYGMLGSFYDIIRTQIRVRALANRKKSFE